jgi:hypothetical protein
MAHCLHNKYQVYKSDQKSFPPEEQTSPTQLFPDDCEAPDRAQINFKQWLARA